MPYSSVSIQYNAGNRLDFSKIPRGSMPPDPPSITSRRRRLLLRVCGARQFAAAPLMEYAPTKDPTN